MNLMKLKGFNRFGKVLALILVTMLMFTGCDLLAGAGSDDKDEKVSLKVAEDLFDDGDIDEAIDMIHASLRR